MCRGATVGVSRVGSWEICGGVGGSWRAVLVSDDEDVWGPVGTVLRWWCCGEWGGRVPGRGWQGPVMTVLRCVVLWWVGWQGSWWVAGCGGLGW